MEFALKFCLALIFLIFLVYSQTIKVEVKPLLNFTITFENHTQKDNLIEFEFSIYNFGSLTANFSIILESECCKIIDEKVINPSEEKDFKIRYLALKNESIKVYLKVNDSLLNLKNVEIKFDKKLKRKSIDLYYIYENRKIKILGNLEGFSFYVINSTTKQKNLDKKYNEIEIENDTKYVDVIFFNELFYDIKRFELKNPSILEKIIFEIRKFTTLTFLN